MSYNFMDAALELIHGIPDYRNRRFLELGCGDAWLLERLSNDGVSVRGTTYQKRDKDYIRGRDYPQDIQVDEGVDLNKPLPYADAEFDVVYSTEVIEHLESHRNFVSECGRVLQPNGWLVLTTPNIHRLISRLHFAVTGVHLVKCPIFQVSEPLERMEEFHHHCVDFVVLHWLLWNSGFRIEKLIPGHVHPASRALWAVAPLLNRFVRPALQRHFPEDEPLDDARKDLINWMGSKVLLTSEHICLLARKTAKPFKSAPGTSTYFAKR